MEKSILVYNRKTGKFEEKKVKTTEVEEKRIAVDSKMDFYLNSFWLQKHSQRPISGM